MSESRPPGPVPFRALGLAIQRTEGDVVEIDSSQELPDELVAFLTDRTFPDGDAALAIGEWLAFRPEGILFTRRLRDAAGRVVGDG